MLNKILYCAGCDKHVDNCSCEESSPVMIGKFNPTKSWSWVTTVMNDSDEVRQVWYSKYQGEYYEVRRFKGAKNDEIHLMPNYDPSPYAEMD